MIKMNYYFAFLFEERPDLHVTIQYMKQLAPHQLIREIQRGDSISQSLPTRVRIRVGQEAMFGPNHDVRVLLPTEEITWPKWMHGHGWLHNGWRPHITTPSDEHLDIVATSLARMRNTSVVAEWELAQGTTT